MASFTLQATFGASYNNSDTVSLSVNTGTIVPNSTTKANLAAGIVVTCNTGAIITAEITSGTCDGITKQITAQTGVPTPTPTATPAGQTPTPTPTATPAGQTPTPTPTPSAAATQIYGSSEQPSPDQACILTNPNSYYSQQFINVNDAQIGDRLYLNGAYSLEAASAWYAIGNSPSPATGVIWIYYEEGVGITALGNCTGPFPTNTPTPVPTVTPTPTPTSPVYSFAVTAYDFVRNDVCNIPVTTTVYTQDFTSWSNITSGDRIYSDSGLTTEIYGGNNFYGMNDGLSGNSIYTFRYSTGFGVDQTAACPTVTPTPTAATPTPTPTGLPFEFAVTAVDFVQNDVCNTPVITTVYSLDFDSWATMGSGARIYTDQALTTEIYGGNNYYGMNDGTTGNSIYTFRYSTGFGVDFKGTCPTVTPTPTPATPTPTPTQGAFNFAITPVDFIREDVCGVPLSQSVYSLDFQSFAEIGSGDRIYSDPELTTEIYGGNNYYGMNDGLSGNSVYYFRYSTGFGVDQAGNCFTPTPTATPTATPTPTPATPTPTPTATPTPTTFIFEYLTTADPQAGAANIGDSCGALVRDYYTLWSTRSTFYDIQVGDIIYSDNSGTLFEGNSDWFGLELTPNSLPGKGIQIAANGEVLAVGWCNTPTPTPTITGTPTPTPTPTPTIPAWVPAGYQYFGSAGGNYDLYKESYIIGEFYYDGVIDGDTDAAREAIYWSKEFVNWVAQNEPTVPDPVQSQTYSHHASGSGISAYSASLEGVLTEKYRITWNEVSNTVVSWDDTYGVGGQFIGTQLTFASSSGDWADGNRDNTAERVVWNWRQD